MIQGNDTMVDTYSNKEETGYGFIVYMMKMGEIHTKIVSTLPTYPYANKKEAKQAGDELVKQARKVDLTPNISGLQKIIGEEESQIVSEITSAINNSE